MKKSQQERLEKRILNIINNDLKFLEKRVAEKDYFGEIKYPIILKGNRKLTYVEKVLKDTSLVVTKTLKIPFDYPHLDLAPLPHHKISHQAQ